MTPTIFSNSGVLINQGFPNLERFFAPRSVAMIGASEDIRKFGGRCTRQLMDFGFSGEIFPINPKRTEIFGKQCYPSIADLPHAPDHIGIALPSFAIPQALEECADKKIPFATIFSSGFLETGKSEGLALQKRIVDIARAGGIRFMGPNCNGMINYVDGFALTSTATISGVRRQAGNIGIVGQSGGAAQVNVMWRAQQLGIDISYQVSCGNASDIDLLDYAGFMVESDHTKVVLILAETLNDGEKLRILARRAADLKKPLIMVKAGKTAAGSRVAASHTGAVTGQDEVCDAILAQLGVLRVNDYTDLYQAAMFLRSGKLPEGNRAAAVSVSGGNLVLLADLGEGEGIEWPTFTDKTQLEIKSLLPGFGHATNPTDLTANAIGQAGTFAKASGLILEDPHIDVLVPVITMSSNAEILSIADLNMKSPKPIAILWAGSCIDEPKLTQQSLVSLGHAIYGDVSSCTKAIGVAIRYSNFLKRLTRPEAIRPEGINCDRARALLMGANGPLSEHDSKELLSCYGLPITREYLATNEEDAVRFAQLMGGPVALKIQSPDIPHKTEANAIKLGVIGDIAVREAYASVRASAFDYRKNATIEGVLIQEMVSEALEMLIGISQDSTFGPILTIGLGGIYVEVFKDVSFRAPPLSRDEAFDAISELRAFPMLLGVRGQSPKDIEALIDCIVRMSWLALEQGHLIEELDVNPLSVMQQGMGVQIIDALVIPIKNQNLI